MAREDSLNDIEKSQRETQSMCLSRSFIKYLIWDSCGLLKEFDAAYHFQARHSGDARYISRRIITHIIYVIANKVTPSPDQNGHKNKYVNLSFTF